MKQEVNNRLNLWVNAFPRVADATAIVAGVIVIIGWIFDVSVLKSSHPDLMSMKANTAIGFCLVGLALLALKRRTRRGNFLQKVVCVHHHRLCRKHLVVRKRV